MGLFSISTRNSNAWKTKFLENDAGSYAFNHVVASAESRWIFIQNAVDYLRKWDFDGIDLDWEYPGLPERGTTEETREQFNDLVKVWELFISQNM